MTQLFFRNFSFRLWEIQPILNGSFYRTCMEGILCPVDDLMAIKTMHFVFFSSNICVSRDLIHLYHMAILAPRQGLNPCPRGHKFYNLDNKGLSGHQNLHFCFSQIYMKVEEMIFYNFIQLYYIAILAPSQDLYPRPKGHEFNN